jgi:glycosyltransferase involved in cell wall biosynthesis
LRKADIVHVFSASYASFLLAPLPAILVARLLGKRVVVNYHSGEAPDHLGRSRLARAVLRRADLNVVPSSFLRDVFAAFGIPATIVANTIDLSRFTYRERRPLRPLLLSTRNFESLYNVACTLRAFARVQRRHRDATLTLVGAGSEEPRLRALAAELKLRNVTFTGAVPPGDIPRYYADADVYVQTSSIDNMPNSVIEAFASGLPAVATRVGGVPAILTDGIHGLLAPDDDDEGVADRICQLLDQPDYARGLAAAARQSCEVYRWPEVRQGWLAAYRSLLSPGARRARLPAEAA